MMVRQTHHKSFWNELKKPFFVMAPMKDVTDVAFRKLLAKCGKPDVFWTEFVSADGLYREVKPLLRDLAFDKDQRPIVAQIFSSKPEMISYAAALCEKLGFDGVDINMGCPDKAIIKQSAGTALIKNPALAVELIKSAKSATELPISVKTRIGYNKETLEEWLTPILEADPAAVTIHLRTYKEMSKVPAHWDLMKKAVEIRNRINPKVLLIGNGDVRDLYDARAKALESGCDGVMVGRALFGNPWLFERSENSPERSRESRSIGEKLSALIELAKDFEKIFPPKDFSILKKHIKAFVAGFDGASELRARLMEANSADALSAQVARYLSGA